MVFDTEFGCRGRRVAVIEQVANAESFIELSKREAQAHELCNCCRYEVHRTRENKMQARIAELESLYNDEHRAGLDLRDELDERDKQTAYLTAQLEVTRNCLRELGVIFESGAAEADIDNYSRAVTPCPYAEGTDESLWWMRGYKSRARVRQAEAERAKLEARLGQGRIGELEIQVADWRSKLEMAENKLKYTFQEINYLRDARAELRAKNAELRAICEKTKAYLELEAAARTMEKRRDPGRAEKLARRTRIIRNFNWAQNIAHGWKHEVVLIFRMILEALGAKGAG